MVFMNQSMNKSIFLICIYIYIYIHIIYMCEGVLLQYFSSVLLEHDFYRSIMIYLSIYLYGVRAATQASP